MWPHMILAWFSGFCAGFILVAPVWVRLRSQRMVRASLADSSFN